MVASPRPWRHRRDSSLTVLVWASAMGTYLLVALGGVTSVLDGDGACTGWPTCDAGPLGGLSGAGALGGPSDLAVAVAVGHRLAAAIVGVVLVVTLLLAWRRGTDRVTASLTLAVLLYPLQVGVGALIAVRGTAPLSLAHLVLGVAIFGLSMLALLWQLERGSAPTPEPTTAGGMAAHGSSPTEPSSIGDDADAAPPPNGRGTGLRDRVGAYYRLTKPRLMWLLCLVAVAAMALAAGPDLAPSTAVATVTGGVLAVGASGTFNNVLERDVDREMDRTADRPLVTGRIPVRRAVAFGGALAALSVVVFVAFVNALSALLALLAVVFYSVVYTLILKPHTSHNIVLGGAVGAFPALIGWAAVENAVGVPAVVLGAVIFLWTPAHFYNLALAYRDDYARAGFPMLPVVRGTATTRRHIFLYLAATLVGSVALGATTSLEWLYATTIVLVGGVFTWTVLRLFRERTERAAFRTFHASNAYLGCLLVAIFLDATIV